jgi:hypothetical protein
VNFLERAEPMAVRGVPVIPLKPKSKSAFLREWQAAGETDVFAISEWNESNSEFNCGCVAKRELGGFWFLDDDSGTLAETVKAETGHELTGFRVKTGRASIGYHYYFQHDAESLKLSNAKINIPGWKGEIRCDDQYVASQLSVHPETGTVYQIENDSKIVSAPAWLLEWLQQKQELVDSVVRKVKSSRTKRVVKPDGSVVFEQAGPDPGFKDLFDRVGWKPLIDRMNKIDDPRMHNQEMVAGKFVYCPMPGHAPRGKEIPGYKPIFGPVGAVPEIVHCFGCDWTGDLVSTVRAFDAGEDGGHVEYATMYDCARAICKQEGLSFEEFFPPAEPEPKEPGFVTDLEEEVPFTAEQEAEFENEYPRLPLPEKEGPSWSDDIYYGLIGDISRKMAEYNESHPAGILLDLVVGLGNMFGRTAYFNINSTRHYTNENLARVGDSAKSRKGGGRDAVDGFLQLVDPGFFQNRVVSGFGSPEAVIGLIKDGSTMQKIDRRTGQFKTIAVPGVLDKRLCIREAELASVFVLASKPNSRFDVVLRDAWDSKPLRNLVKGQNADGINMSASCQEPHISISGDTTRSELLRKMPDGADENGFGNRFLYCYVYRRQLCPNGGPDLDWSKELIKLLEVVAFARSQKRVRLSKNAKKAWQRMYARLEENSIPGLAGKMTARGAAHVRRLALIYALVDLSDRVEVKHLNAAKLLWDYCSESARFIFNKGTKEQLKILKFVEEKQTTSLTEIHALFQRHKSADWIKTQLHHLEKQGFIKMTDGIVTKTQKR